MKLFILLVTMICSNLLFAKELEVNDAFPLRINNAIDTVFVTDSDILDYKVIDENNIIIYSKKPGKSKVMVYGNNGVVYSQYFKVYIDTDDLENKIKKLYPSSNVSIEQYGESIAVRGIVDDIAQRDSVYELVAKYNNLRLVDKYGESDDSFGESVIEDAIEVSDNEITFSKNYTYENLIEDLEVKTLTQVNVKVVIAEVNRELTDTLGIDWSTSGNAAGQFEFNTIDASELSALVYAMSDESMGSVLAEPNLTVASGEEASFLVGGETPLISSSSDGTDISFKNFGIGLAMSAKVKSDQNIRLVLQPTVTKIDQFIENRDLSVPQLSARKVKTTIEIKDGDSFMIGGLLTDESNEQKSKIPILGDIPFLGGLFSGASTRSANTEVVIVATVNIVNPVEPKELQVPEFEKTQNIERLFETKYKNAELSTDRGFY
ncbi:type II and III secretion system protein family protein [Vibrio paucivorans]